MTNTKPDYKNTVFLPKTDFPMRGNLPIREPEILAQWQANDLYTTIRAKSKGRPKFTLHDGPPYANGPLHMGHALNKILKDIVIKTQQMMGRDAAFIPGWDCHGLPIEWKVEEAYRAQGLIKGNDRSAVDLGQFRADCRAFAQKWLDVQRDEFKRLGIIGRWDKPYTTMAFDAEAAIIDELGKFIMNGGLYRGLKPVMWSVVEKTALAEAEIEYHDHTSDSIYVGFPIVAPAIPALANVKAVIWTTTPWTLPANRAIAYSAEISYAVVEVLTATDLIPAGAKFLVAQDLVVDFCKATALDDHKVIATLPGNQLKGLTAQHPFYDFTVPFLAGEHVTIDVGTGLVHTAPSHGLEDFALGQVHGLEVPELVGPDGVYAPQTPLFAGDHIFKVAPKVIEALQMRSNLLKHDKYRHSYPHSWRSKAPLIYRATPQWFISMEANNLRQKALDAIETVDWIPAIGKNRIKAMVESRPDWCLSRQRAWGTPITVFVNKATNEVLRDAAVNARIVEKVRAGGADVWFTTPAQEFLGATYNADDFEKVEDIMDVWFDSGSTHSFVIKNEPEIEWPADLYLEGSDQHRGWFQLSLLEACGTVGQAPFKKVLTHGFVVDDKGYKMSKSVGNTTSPQEIVANLGADILRLWVVAADYSQDLRIGAEILKSQEDIYRRLRNTLRYLLGALDGFTQVEAVAHDALPSLEKWVLHRLAELDRDLRHAAETFDFHEYHVLVHNFCATDLSAFYFDIRKDSLYCDNPRDIKRRATRTAMDHVFRCLVKWLAPLVSFTAEEAWRARYGNDADSVHLQDFETIPAPWLNPDLGAHWDKLRDIRRVMTGALEIERAARTIGSSLQAEISIYADAAHNDLLESIDVAELAITSAARIVVAQPPASAFTLEDVEGVGVVVTPAQGEKCERCWRILPEVRQPHAVCKRCTDVLETQ